MSETPHSTEMPNAENEAGIIYTIGHGRHGFPDFLALLREHGVELIVDVRSVARSRWPQFNRLVLDELLREHGIGYEWLPECGGKVVAPPADLARGLDRVAELAGDARICLMCSESQPLTAHRIPRANCHRVGMLAGPLRARGFELLHILPRGKAIAIDEAAVPSLW